MNGSRFNKMLYGRTVRIADIQPATIKVNGRILGTRKIVYIEFDDGATLVVSGEGDLQVVVEENKDVLVGNNCKE